MKEKRKESLRDRQKAFTSQTTTIRSLPDDVSISRKQSSLPTSCQVGPSALTPINSYDTNYEARKKKPTSVDM